MLYNIPQWLAVVMRTEAALVSTALFSIACLGREYRLHAHTLPC